LATVSYVEQIRRELPATTAHIYLNTGTFGPLPTCVTQAMQQRLQQEWQDGRIGPDSFKQLSEIYMTARAFVARLLHAKEREIALTNNTTDGINIAINGVNWHQGDEIITTNHEHMGVLAPLYQNRDRHGVVIRFADLGPKADRPAVEAIRPLITSRTRMIVLSHITWTTGTRLDIHAVGQLGRELGIPVLIDGAQSAGAIPLDMQELQVDFYAIPMQKWLCGPDGTGALYVCEQSLHYITPTSVGYMSVKHEDGVDWMLADGAQRFEFGGRQTAAIAGQAAVLKWLEESVHHDWMFERIASLHTYAFQALQHVPGLTLLTPEPGVSGLISFTLVNRSDSDVVQALREKNILIRNIPSTKALRISTGFYNTEDEIDLLIKALTTL
jgi:L-cysteine/cystine lyase